MITAALLAASAFTTCSWDHPGADRFTGDTAAFIMAKYTDIPLPERTQLAAMADKHKYTDRVVITRDDIRGGFEYAPTISMMGFGTGKVCQNVTRAGLPEQQEALVYTVGEYSIGVAAECGNPFRLSLIPTRGVTVLAVPIRVDRIQPRAAVGTRGWCPTASPAPFAALYAGSDGYYGVPVYIPGGGGYVGGVYPAPPINVPAPPVPEPASWLLLACGLALLWRLRGQRCV